MYTSEFFCKVHGTGVIYVYQSLLLLFLFTLLYLVIVSFGTLFNIMNMEYSFCDIRSDNEHYMKLYGTEYVDD